MSLPPGPDLPSWSQAQAWIEDPVGFWRRCHDEFGEVFTVQLGSLGPVVLFCEPDSVRQIFHLPADSYECRQYNEQYKYVMGERSLLVSDGPRHRSRRRLIIPQLNKATTSTLPIVIQRLTEQVAASWPLGKPFSVRASIHLLCLKIMLHVVFGDPESGISQEITKLFRDEVLKDLGTWGPWRRFGRLQGQLRGLISHEIRARRACPNMEVRVLFDALVLARDETGEPLGDDEIQDHIFTMLVAGVDPTAIALTWALYWLHEAPEAKETLLRELSHGTTGGDQSLVADLPYLSAVCNEVLRMFPVVTTPSGRKLTTSVEIAGRPFDPEVTLLPCTYLVHHRADLYPEPDRFRPERFLEPHLCSP